MEDLEFWFVETVLLKRNDNYWFPLRVFLKSYQQCLEIITSAIWLDVFVYLVYIETGKHIFIANERKHMLQKSRSA
jgi:hypothetical protein